MKAQIKYSYLIYGFFFLFSHSTIALVDHGRQGHTFPIGERSLLELIYNRLSNIDKRGHIEKLQEEFKQRVLNSIQNPKPVPGISRATNSSVRYLDPTYLAPNDVRDLKGNILIKKGTALNPLNFAEWQDSLVVIDGTDHEQVKWAVQLENASLMLINGSPTQLQKDHQVHFYYDYAGVGSRKFHVKHVPTVISQAGLKLKVEEVWKVLY